MKKINNNISGEARNMIYKTKQINKGRENITSICNNSSRINIYNTNMTVIRVSTYKAFFNNITTE